MKPYVGYKEQYFIERDQAGELIHRKQVLK